MTQGKIITPSVPLYDYTMTIKGQMQAPDEGTVKMLLIQQVQASFAVQQTVREIAIEAKPTNVLSPG